MKSFLVYWKPDQKARVGEPLDRAHGVQLERVNPGDELWLVTIPNDGPGKETLELLGRLLVKDLWPEGAEHFVSPLEAEPMRVLALADIQDKLRFVSRTRDRLKIVDGKVGAQQLQTIRLLTPEIAELLRSVWEKS